MNPWHDIPIGEEAPDHVNAVIEVPRGSTVKYELDQELGIIRVSHMLYPPVSYPGNYGFIPRTLDEDGDPLDMMVIMRDPVAPLSVCEVRPIGLVDMLDDGEQDHKVLCVLLTDPRYQMYESFDALPQYESEELQWFFEEYQGTAHETVKVQGIDDAGVARERIERCAETYRASFA